MSIDSNIDLNKFRVGNYVRYRGPMEKVNDRFGIVQDIKTTFDQELINIYRIYFGDKIDPIVISVRQDYVYPIMLGTFGLRKELLEAFNFSFEDEKNTWLLDEITLTDVRAYDSKNQSLAIDFRVSPVDSFLTRNYRSVHSIHHIQNYSHEILDRDVIAESRPILLGQKWYNLV